MQGATIPKPKKSSVPKSNSAAHTKHLDISLVQHRSLAKLALERFARNRLAVAGALIIVAMVGFSFAGPFFSPYDPLEIDFAAKFAPPLSEGHFLGGDEMGRDLLTRLLDAGQVSLTVGFVSMVMSVTFGTIAGATAGFYGGWIDTIIMRFVDAVLSFPTIFLLLAFAAFIQPGLLTIVIIIALTSWMEVARIVRSQVLSIRENEYVTAARSLGASNRRIIVRQIIPNSMAPIVVVATLNVANAILLESYISFLGYGIQPPTASWGNMLNNAQSYFGTAPWVAIFPGVVITLAVSSFNFIGDGLRDALDPKLGAR